MALGTAVNLAEINRFAKSNNPIYLKETDSAGSPLTTGDGTQWVCIGTTKNSTFDPVVDEFTDKGDGGTRVVKKDILEALELSTVLMQRGVNSRNFTLNASDKYYQYAIGGATIGTLTEIWAGWGVVSKKFGPYPIGGDGQIQGIKISTIANAAAITVTLPTALVTGTVTIAAGAGYVSADV